MHIGERAIKRIVLKINLALKPRQTPTLLAFHPHSFKGFNIVRVIEYL